MRSEIKCDAHVERTEGEWWMKRADALRVRGRRGLGGESRGWGSGGGCWRWQ